MTVEVVNATREKVLADRAVEAIGFWPRLIGLMGRKQLALGEGLLLRPCNAIHTFFMRIDIDALFLDRQGVVVRAYHALPPWRTTAFVPRAAAVLELPAGVAGASQTQEGDRLVFHSRAHGF